MKRLFFLAFAIGLAVSAASCGTLFAPSGCTSNVFIIDSLKQFQGPDTTIHVDTLSRFKLCAE